MHDRRKKSWDLGSIFVPTAGVVIEPKKKKFDSCFKTISIKMVFLIWFALIIKPIQF